MGYQILPISSSQQWENFLGKHAPNALFQSWDWGEVQNALGEKVWRFALQSNAQIVGILQITKVVAKRGTFLHVRHGPVLTQYSPAALTIVTSFVREMAQKEHAWFVRISPQMEASRQNLEQFRRLGYMLSPIHAMDAEHCWVLDVGPSEEELLAHMRKTTRYEIRRAQKLGVEVVASTNPKDLDTFLQLYDETAKRQGFVPHRGIREEFMVFQKAGKALLLLGLHQKSVLAGAMILFYGNSGIYHHGASLPTPIPASYLVQWEAIAETKKRGLSVYNFWGIAPENTPRHPWWGLTLFKKGFGGREIISMHAQDLPVSPLYMIPRAIETVRRWAKGY